MATIEARHYAEARTALLEDAIVQDMAKGLRDVPLTELAHDDGTPRFAFMQRANATYAERGGTNQAHIGAVAEALLILRLRDSGKTTTTTTTTTTTATAVKKTSRYSPDYAAAYRARRLLEELEDYNIYDDDGEFVLEDNETI